jgi:heavy metal translocating P-type ATPase
VHVLRRTLRPSVLLLALTVTGLLVGILLTVARLPDLARYAWLVPSVVVAVRLAWSIVRDLLDRKAGVDVIALLAIGGALVLDETFAASVIALMLATGEALERYADGQARRELSALLGRAPQVVQRYLGTELETVAASAVNAGDRLLVRPGDVVPVDGVVRRTAATLDESALTGESRLVVRDVGELVASGVVNAGSGFDLDAIASADASTYAGIVRLVEEAGRAKAPFVRLADRYAILFVPLALGMSGIAWLLTGDAGRALAVLVVATPCPLLLAAPIAIVAGMSRCAKRGIIVKGGGPLEALANAAVLLFDKTGTLTSGRPHVAGIETDGRGADEVLRLAASLEQASPHVLAGAIVQAARARQLDLMLPLDASEEPGAGARGRVDGREIRVGTATYSGAGSQVSAWARDVSRRASLETATAVFVGVDGQIAGAILLDDPLRPESPRVVRALRRTGVGRIVMVTGDRHGVADVIGSAVGLDAVLAERTPADKVDAVVDERRDARGPLVMVGDGINDAPALAAADVGVAMGARGATASSEAADVVIAVDRLDRLVEAIQIARRARTIALQSVIAGMGLSIAAMVAAAFGFLPVVAGALLQEAIDVAVILNALRALRDGLEAPVVVAGWAETRRHLEMEHRQLADGIAGLRTTADGLDAADGPAARDELDSLRRFLAERLAPHEEAEDRRIYPMLDAAFGSDDATAPLHRTHAEIFRAIRLLDRLTDGLPDEGPTPDDRTDLRRVLYGLDAVLRLHMAQEEELYDTVSGSATDSPSEAVAAA